MFNNAQALPQSELRETEETPNERKSAREFPPARAMSRGEPLRTDESGGGSGSIRRMTLQASLYLLSYDRETKPSK